MIRLCRRLRRDKSASAVGCGATGEASSDQGTMQICRAEIAPDPIVVQAVHLVFVQCPPHLGKEVCSRIVEGAEVGEQLHSRGMGLIAQAVELCPIGVILESKPPTAPAATTAESFTARILRHQETTGQRP